MALVLADRVKETSTTTGTITYVLAGAVDGFESFASIGDGNTTYYACIFGSDFEVGIGTYTASGTTLARTTILQSSNSDNAVDWGAGTKTLFCTQPAEKAVFLDSDGNIAAFNGSNLTNVNATQLNGQQASHYLDYGNFTNTPTIPTNNNQLTNGAGYITSVPAQSFASLTGKPTTISGYGITDAFDGAYGSLTGTPSIPTNNNELTNGAGYITSTVTGDLTLTSTANDGGVLKLVSDDPTDATDFGTEGQIQFFAENSASESTQYYSLQMRTADITDGTEDGWLYLNSIAGGTLATANAFGSDGTFYLLGNGNASNAVIKWFQTRGTTFNVTLTLSTPSTNRTITLPDASGTVLTTGNSDAPTTTTSSGDADFVLIDDGGVMKKITPTDLGVGGGGGGGGITTGKAIAMAIVFG